MKFGLFAINFNSCGDPEVAVRVAQHAEAAGFESVWTGEHFAFPDPPPAGFPIPTDSPFLDTAVALTLIATNTTTIKIGTGIILLPLRNPVVLAKELASVDVVSKGRLIAGVGTGYLPSDFDSVGVPLTGRGTRMDEYIQAMRALWTMDHPAFTGQHVSFSGIDAHPRPWQKSGPPIVVGAGRAKAARRAVTMADGWYGFGFTVDQTSHHLDRINAAAEEYERPESLATLEKTVTPIGPLDRGVVNEYEAMGIDRLVLLPQPDAEAANRHQSVPVDDILRNIDWVADNLADK